MANPWFRLWSDMANDPKWRTIARISKQSIGNVVAVYIHMMTCASNATERGRTQGWCDEDVATALDIETAQVVAIREAMQDRVLDGDYLKGWAKRQPAREDGSAERAKAHREAKKQEGRTQPNATERNRTLDKIREDKEEEEQNLSNPNGLLVDSQATDENEDDKIIIKIPKPESNDCPHQEIIALYHEILPVCPEIRAWTPSRQKHLRARWKEAPERQNLDYWRKVFDYVSTCDFLVGKISNRSGGRPFCASLAWIVKQENFAKIREGAYENRK